MKRIVLSILLPLAFAVSLRADDFPELFNTEPEAGEGPMPASEAAVAFTLPEGFVARVFASEPEVQNPIAMAWDVKGRMWVAENFTYGKRGVRIERRLRDRVLVFEDSDWDGVADKRTVFIDDVQVLTSVEIGRGGVWLMCPPTLLFVPDRDGDLVPDGEPEVVLDGFEVAENNYHNFANGLRWGPDGWLYGRCGHSCPGWIGRPGTPQEKRIPIDGGIWRYHPEREVVEVLCHGTVNPWGHDWDRNGELFFINTVIGHLWHLIPGAHYKESFGQSMNPLVFSRIDQHADHYHYDQSRNWTKSRGGAANEFGGGHSHIGMTIYDADHLPEAWRGKLLTWNQHGRRLNMERLERHGSGFVGKHEPDPILAGDSWFRGLEIQTGPDGALYALDWSDTGECHEHTGVHRTSGRIYRISHGEPEKPEFSDLESLDPEAVVRLLRHPNNWWRRMARRELNNLGHLPEPILTAFMNESSGTVTQGLTGAWIVFATGAINEPPPIPDADVLEDLPREMTEHEEEAVRVWGIRFLSDHWPLDTILGPVHPHPGLSAEEWGILESLAAEDESALVRLTLASTLQRLPLKNRADLAKALAARSEDSTDHNLPHMVWFGIMPLVNTDPGVLVEIAEASDWPDLRRWIARALAGGIEKQPENVERILDLAAADPGNSAPLLEGLRDGFQGWQRAPKPGNWDQVAKSLGGSGIVDELGTVFGDGIALDRLRKLVNDSKADLATRSRALQSLIQAKPDDLRSLCEKHLGTRELNRIAVRGLAGFDDPAIADRLVSEFGKGAWRRDRNLLVDALSTRPGWAEKLLAAVASGQIERAAITPFHARQIQGLGDPGIAKKLAEVWGEVRNSDAARKAQRAELKSRLTPEVLAGANLGRGRVLHEALCSSCHKLYGEGGELGPDLTGSGRHHLDYLLENILDPSAVVSAEFRMTNLELKDGRHLGGVVASENDPTLTLRMLTEELTLEKTEIIKREPANDSIMPTGLLDALPEDQVRDLLAYLMHPRQVPQDE